MAGSVLNYGKRVFRIALMFNTLLCIVSAVGLLLSFYGIRDSWKPYAPYLINGSLFWVVGLASVMNVFAAVGVCREVETGRLWFHHYVYGFVVVLITFVSVVLFTSVSLVNFLIGYITNATVNAMRFFFYGGLALVLDDFPDISGRMGSFLFTAKTKTYRVRSLAHALQFVLGIVSFYVFLSVCFWLARNPEGPFLSNFIVAGSLLVTSLTCFGSIRWHLWRSTFSWHSAKHLTAC